MGTWPIRDGRRAATWAANTPLSISSLLQLLSIAGFMVRRRKPKWTGQAGGRGRGRWKSITSPMALGRVRVSLREIYWAHVSDYGRKKTNEDKVSLKATSSTGTREKAMSSVEMLP